MDSGIFFLLVVVVIGGLSLAHYIRNFYRAQKVKELYDRKKQSYDAILQQYIPYYRNLDAAQRERFLKRALIFKSTKKFEFVEMLEEEHMSLLISAAAIQLTFGLQHYLMDHFDKIYIMKRDYHFGLFNVPFQGHVSDDGIYLSWNNFLRSYANYSDGDNVALHEMAHALAYVNFTVHDGEDEAFQIRFMRFTITGRQVFNRMKAGEMNMLGSYAATNYQEFWAVCVENFFERPEAFKMQLPELYEAICKLLNQDLLKPGLLLQPVQEVYA
ncbi:zinc-dependent peptidase [Niastella caeni]|uniref:Zinc-dependent peptidase n=1 Tax=Niastella caeni TaxID=2569763 RepID=A0A4S8HYP5_9BACT|nr:zinc-dependent peptidase [Niastella caeni]THU40913.1 zinc-dependent peptidase [Niastella caeni]